MASRCGFWFGFVYFLALPHRTWAPSSPSRGRAACVGSPVAAPGPGGPFAVVSVGFFLRERGASLPAAVGRLCVRFGALSVCRTHFNLGSYAPAVSFLRALWSASLPGNEQPCRSRVLTALRAPPASRRGAPGRPPASPPHAVAGGWRSFLFCGTDSSLVLESLCSRYVKPVFDGGHSWPRSKE